eukprot:TRINITY_DN53849_c0_g1_i1.p1 TRINITY_DN53849_c0_g1~~TRINITY_DN53849_c0_g1_i1.p1  ORF type:complete len:499 (-),score=27.64 TRINITY_DN53849_c0_g1_i1:115-1611(-)
MNIKLYPKIRNVFAAASLLLASQVATAQYCIPVAGSNGNCKGTTPLAGDHIINVKTSGAVQNISNANNACNSATGYTDYTNTVATNKCIANAATNVTCTVDVYNHGQTLYPYRICVWVDWNQNDTFDNNPYSLANPTGELMIVTPASFTGYSTSGTAFSTIAVPPAAKNGLTRMRVRAGTRNGQNPPFPPTNYDPCLALSYQWGEVEDYDFEVINPCLPPKSKAISNLTYKSATINWAVHPTAIMYEYWVSQLNVPPTSFGYYYTTKTAVPLPDATTIPSLNCDTKYYYWVRSICDTVGKSSPDWGYSPWRLDSFTTPPCCYTPEVTISYITSTTAIASWTPVPSVVDYEYAMRTDTITPLKGTITTATSLLLRGLSPATELYFFLRARCSPTPLSEWGLDSFLTQPATGINPIGEVKEFGIQAFPNPAKDKINLRVVKGLKQGMGYIEIMDLSGRVMKKEQMESDMQDISIESMPAGVYIIKYTDDKHSNVIKLNKE